MSAQPLPYELVLLGFLQGPDLYEQVSRRLAASSLAGARDFELEELICVRRASELHVAPSCYARSHRERQRRQ